MTTTTSTTNTTTTTELNRQPTTTSTSTTSMITTMEGRDRGQGGWKWTQTMCRTRHLGLSESFFFLSSCILILTDVFYRYISSVRVMVSLWWQTSTTAITTGQWPWPPPPPTWSGFGRDGAWDAYTSWALFFFFCSTMMTMNGARDVYTSSKLTAQRSNKRQNILASVLRLYVPFNRQPFINL